MKVTLLHQLQDYITNSSYLLPKPKVGARAMLWVICLHATFLLNTLSRTCCCPDSHAYFGPLAASCRRNSIIMFLIQICYYVSLW